MRRKKGIDLLQNLAILLLMVSAAFIISRFPFIRSSWAPQVQALLSTGGAPVYDAPADMATAISRVHLAVMGNSEYGRSCQRYASVEEDHLVQLLPLFREALGSAAPGGEADHPDLQQALCTPSLCVDLARQLPLEVVAAWLGVEVSFTGTVRSMALTTGSDTAHLYLWSDQGILRCNTALSASAVEELALTFSPNGGSFGFESGHSTLAPYTILAPDTSPLPRLHSALPDGYSAYNLLTALDFNPHTNSRYFESGGTEVVEVPSGSVRVGPDGRVHYSGDSESPSALYRVSAAGEKPTAVEALDAARRLAAALSEGTSASRLYLSAMEPTSSGWRISFCCQAEGIPVLMNQGEQALTVTIQGRSVTALSYYCRTYTPLEETTVLLPSTMAAAIAARHPAADLSIHYVDSGADILSARWVTG